MAVPSNRNKIVKVFEKRSKCKDLEIKIAKMWKTATYTTPVVFGALRVIKTGLKKCVDSITGAVSIDYLQIIIYSSGSSSHPQKRSVNKGDSLATKT